LFTVFDERLVVPLDDTEPCLSDAFCEADLLLKIVAVDDMLAARSG
jgi:hypothetical protein